MVLPSCAQDNPALSTTPAQGIAREGFPGFAAVFEMMACAGMSLPSLPWRDDHFGVRLLAATHAPGLACSTIAARRRTLPLVKHPRCHWRNPSMSPAPLIKWAPAGGLIKAAAPFLRVRRSRKTQCVGLPESAFVTWVQQPDAKAGGEQNLIRIKGVDYDGAHPMRRAGLVYGAPGIIPHGCVGLPELCPGQAAVRAAKISSCGFQWQNVVAMIVDGCCASHRDAAVAERAGRNPLA